MLISGWDDTLCCVSVYGYDNELPFEFMHYIKAILSNDNDSDIRRFTAGLDVAQSLASQELLYVRLS